MAKVVAISAPLARLCMKGILLVRMTWIMRVCVINDSTNQPVWNNDACDGSQQSNIHSMTKNVV